MLGSQQAAQLHQMLETLSYQAVCMHEEKMLDAKVQKNAGKQQAGR